MEQKPKNIFIIGPQCTGKTTLLRALQEYYAQPQQRHLGQPNTISEVARTVMQQLDFERHDILASPDRSLLLQQAIMEAQYRAETSLESTAVDWYISDRSGIDPIVYARYYIGEEAANQLLMTHQWQTLEQHLKAGLVILCEAGSAWLTDDGTRLMPNDRDDWINFYHTFCDMLSERQIGYKLISSDVTDIGDRVNLVSAAHARDKADTDV